MNDMKRALRQNSPAAILTVALVLAGTTPRLSAQQQPTSEARIQELIRLAAARAASQVPQTQTSQTTARDPNDPRPVVRLSLDDAVRLTLEKNLDIAVQRLNPQ